MLSVFIPQPFKKVHGNSCYQDFYDSKMFTSQDTHKIIHAEIFSHNATIISQQKKSFLGKDLTGIEKNDDLFHKIGSTVAARFSTDLNICNGLC